MAVVLPGHYATERFGMEHLAARLRTLGPQGTLDRGYALVLDEKNRPITRVEKTRDGQAVRLVLSRGTAEATLTGRQPGKTLLETLAPEVKTVSLAPKKVDGKKPKKK